MKVIDTYILSSLKLSKNMQFGANADIYMIKKLRWNFNVNQWDLYSGY